MRELTGLVEAVCLSRPGVRVAKQPVKEAMLGPYGFEGDRHAGEFVRVRGGEQAPNRRQWSAVSSGEVEELCRDLGVALFSAGALGENLRLAGIRLASLSAGAVLEFPSGARLRVGGQNDPCVNAAAELAATYGEHLQREFVRGAFGRRGVIGTVLEPGIVRQGDAVMVVLPDEAGARLQTRG